MKNRIIATIMLVMLLVSSVSVVSAASYFVISNKSTKTFSEGSQPAYGVTPGEKELWVVHFEDNIKHTVGAVFLRGTDTLASALWCFPDNFSGYSNDHPYKKAYENKRGVKVVWKMRRDNDRKYANEYEMYAEGTFYPARIEV